jgi:hypothetical protein
MSSDLELLQRAIAYSLRGLDDSQTQLRPRSRRVRWSIQQTIEHLLLSYRATAGVVTERIEKQRATLARPSPLQHMAQYTVVRLGYFPRGRKAPAPVMPPETVNAQSGDALTEAARGDLLALETLFDEAEEVFGAKRCASHLVLGPMSIAQWRRFHWIHGEHHLKQILAVRKAYGV